MIETLHRCRIGEPNRRLSRSRNATLSLDMVNSLIHSDFLRRIWMSGPLRFCALSSADVLCLMLRSQMKRNMPTTPNTANCPISNTPLPSQETLLMYCSGTLLAPPSEFAAFAIKCVIGFDKSTSVFRVPDGKYPSSICLLLLFCRHLWFVALCEGCLRRMGALVGRGWLSSALIFTSGTLL